MEKYIKDHAVGVLVSRGHGAGWSTWADTEYSQLMLMDKGLVELALAEASEDEVKAYLEKITPEGQTPYTGGWRGIDVEWVAEGTPFKVTEYDGAEHLEVMYLGSDVFGIA